MEDAIILYDAVSNKSRGFGFVSFKDEESVARVLSQSSVHEFHGKTIEIKRALPRDQRVGVGGWPFPGVLPGAGVNPAVLGMPHMGALLGAGAGYPLPSVGHALPGFNAGMPGLVVPGPGAAALPQQYHLAQLRMAQAQQQMMQQHYASLAMPASVGPLNPMLSPGYEARGRGRRAKARATSPPARLSSGSAARPPPQQSQPPLVPQRSMGLASRGMAAANPLTGVLEAAGVPSVRRRRIGLQAHMRTPARLCRAASSPHLALPRPSPQLQTASANAAAANAAAASAVATAAADPTPQNVAVAAATANAAVMAAKVAADVAGATAAADPTAANVEQAQTAAATAATASIIDAAITAMAEKRADEVGCRCRSDACPASRCRPCACTTGASSLPRRPGARPWAARRWSTLPAARSTRGCPWTRRCS